MKVSYEECAAAIKTKSEPSHTVKDLWVSRSAIAIQLSNRMQPVFGFAAGYDRKKCETSSFYEVLEHLVFLPYLYDEVSFKNAVTFISDELNLHCSNEKRAIQEFLIGSSGPKGVFYGNGCAISNNIESAILHSKRELLERHICCEAWYHHTRPLFQELDFRIETLNPAVNITIYKTDTISEGAFAMAALTCEETGFFAIGAAIRDSLELAYQHAISEVVMLFEDAKKGRNGLSTTERSQKQILSLRDRKTSEARKIYFQNFIENYLPLNAPVQPVCHTIVFEPFPKIYAARTFSENCIDPRWFETKTDLPIMPLF